MISFPASKGGFESSGAGTVLKISEDLTLMHAHLPPSPLLGYLDVDRLEMVVHLLAGLL